MEQNKLVPKKEFRFFIKNSAFLEFYYFLYTTNQLKDAFIDQNAKLLEILVKTDAYHAIRYRAKHRLFASYYKLPFDDYKNLLAIEALTQRLEFILYSKKLI